MRRSTFSRVVLRRPGRLALVAGTAALGIGLLAAPASAAPAVTAFPSAPVVTPSTTGPVAIGAPMVMHISKGSAADHVRGYAWSWGPPNAPTYIGQPACGSQAGGVHFICGSKVKVQVAPERPPFDRFTVWAFDAAGDRSPGTTVTVNTLDNPTALYPVTHQWTTDQFSTVPPAGSCSVATSTVECVPDTAGVDATHPNGAQPLLLPAGSQWDDSGASGYGVPGVLTFGPGSTPAGTAAPVVQTWPSFTAAAWLTPTAAPSGTAATALSEEGRDGAGFELGLTGDGHWQFRVHTSTGEASAVSYTTAGTGSAVYIAGVWDAVNHEVRLYVNGSPMAVVGFVPRSLRTADGPATVGARLSSQGVIEPWTGQIGNPLLAQAPLSNDDLSMLSFESFFPGGNYGLG